MKCPKCNIKWEYDSEQAIAVELQGSCISCRRFEITKSKIDEILDEQKRRKAYYVRGNE
mgnify:CR=1 FL=1